MPRPERPLDAGGGPLSEFAAGLRLVREKAGRPGYRELAGRAHFSAATLSAAAAGKRLPSLAVTLAYVEACGGDKSEWEQRWRSVAAQLGGAPDGVPAAGEPVPYRGLACFQPEDAPWFFGRDDVVRQLVQRLTQRRLLVALGPSGVGKSSVLRAGLVPAATRGDLGDGQPWPVVVMTPGADPLQELAVRLATLAGVPAGALLDDWALDPARLHLTVRQVLCGRATGSQLLLVVDQFEEVFTVCDAGRRAAWVATLVAATRAPDTGLRVVLGVRADFYDQCLQVPELVEELRDGHVPIGAMTAGQLREAIVRPAQQAGLMVEGALVTTVMAEVQGRAGALPLVSHVLLEAWHRRRGSTVTVTAYEAAGGVAGAIAQTAERIWTELDETQRRSTRDAVLRLVQVGEQGEVTRRRVSRSEFAADHIGGDAALGRLAAARLLTLDRDTVEITHEALIEAWPRLRAWVDEDRDGIRVHRHLTAAASTWDSLGRDPGDLYRGARLSTAAQWRDSRSPALSGLEEQFITASLAVQQREASARHRRRRLGTVALTIVVLVITALGGIAWIQSGKVRDERDLAVSRRLTAEARAHLRVDPELALLLAEQAYRRHADPDSDAALRQAAAESRLLATYADYQAGVIGAVISPNGQQIASIEQNGGVCLRDRTGQGSTRTLRQDGEAYADVAFSPDGRWLATAGSRSANGTSTGVVVIWDLARPGAEPKVLRGGDRSEVAIAYAPDSRTIASVDDDGALRIWDSTSDRTPSIRRGHAGAAGAVAFSPDGTRVATGGTDDGTVRIWDAIRDRPSTVLHRHGGSVTSVAFSPDGALIASGDSLGTLQIRPVHGTRAPVALADHESYVSSVAFSPDGKRVVTASADRTIRVRELANPQQALVLRGHQGAVSSVVFSPDGRQLVSGSYDRTVRIWDAAGESDPVIVSGHPRSAGTVVVSPGGRYTASDGSDGSIQISSTIGTEPPRMVRGNVTPTRQMALSADGRWLVAVAADGPVRAWDLAGAALPIQLRCADSDPHIRAVAAAVSADGTTIAAACADGNVRTWDVSGHAEPRTFPNRGGLVAFGSSGRDFAASERSASSDTIVLAAHDTPLRGQDVPAVGLVVSSDGQHVASVGVDGAIRVWPVTGGTPTLLPGTASTVAISPDGQYVASVGAEQTIQLRRIDAGAPPIAIPGYGPAPTGVTFSADGRNLVTTHTDGTTRRWLCAACGSGTEVLQAAQQRTTRQLTPDERRTFLG